MSKFITVILLVICSFVLAACEPKLDTSSDKALEASGEKVYEALDAEQKVYYSEAIGYFSDEASGQIAAVAPGDAVALAKRTQKVIAKMGEILDGLTGKEIIDLYLSRLKRDKAEMDAKVSSMKKDRDIIDKFTLSEASIYTGDDFMKTPRFKFSATNGCDAGIKKATFYISVVEKDSGGVVKDDFVEFVFNDPISVGESAGYSNALGFVEWSPYFRMADESGVTLLVYPVKLVAEEGVVLADTMSLPAAQKRLAFIDRRLN